MLDIGSLIDNKYRILDIVGEGGMSVVYLARNEKANKSWAVKEVKKMGVEDLEVKKSSLIAEIELLKKLNHPNLPTIVDIIDTDDSFLVVMDYIEGNDLDFVLEESGALKQQDVVMWAKQLCDVLRYLHSRNPSIIYRDMKPGNIMLKPDGNISVIDFGTAREVEIKNVKNTRSLGTEGYAAPEQYGQNAYADERTDIYNLGATLFHLLTGRRPDPCRVFESPIRQINPELSGGLEKIIIKCTQLNPEERYQSCDELAYDLEHYKEIDDKYINTQKKRLIIFSSVIVTSLLCFAISACAAFMHNSQVDILYNRYIQSDKPEDYALAIQLQPENVVAYRKCLDYVIKDETIKDEETASVIEKFNLIEDKDNNGESVYPLVELAKSNIKDYVDICFSVGCQYFDKYQTVESRSIYSAEWFKKVLPSNYDKLDYSKIDELKGITITIENKNYELVIGEQISKEQFEIALICAKLGDCKSSVQSLENLSNETSLSSYTAKENSYKSLWENIINLQEISTQIYNKSLESDFIKTEFEYVGFSIDVRLIIVSMYNEIVNDINLYKEEIISYNKLSQDDLVGNSSNDNSDGILVAIKNIVVEISNIDNEQIAFEAKNCENIIDSEINKINQLYIKKGNNHE